MTTAILSLAQGIPQYSLSQAEIGERLSHRLGLDDEEAWLLEKIYKNSSIGRRYSVCPDILPACRTVGMSERNSLYKKEAPQLALCSASQAIKEWGGSPKEITHVLSISCTGAITPGIEHYLARELALNPHTSLLGINFMGCHGAFKGLKVASKIAQADPKHRILMVCTELCTLHIKPKRDIESIVIQSLFGDGSAAAVIGASPRGGEKSLFEIHAEYSHLIPESEGDMTWDAGDEGFEMTLSSRIPQLIEDNMASFAGRWLSRPFEQYTWAVHPGGKSVIESVEKALRLEHAHTASSWDVLERYGNISSATFLYVLHAILKRKLPHQEVVGLGFGPGLTVEGLLLHKKDG